MIILLAKVCHKTQTKITDMVKYILPLVGKIEKSQVKGKVGIRNNDAIHTERTSDSNVQ